MLDYECKKCGKVFSELVGSYDEPVLCPICKEKAERIYYGKISGSFGKKGGGCDGDCKNCSGCGKR